MCRTYEFITVPFIFEHCEMTKIDRPTLFYAIIADLAPNLFCFAFSCLGYEMSKIFFTLRKPREHEKQQRAKLIKRSLHFVLTITILIVLESSFVNIFFILYFVDSNKYENIIKIIDAIDFYSYAGFCIVLGLYFIRFAIPIYTIYKQILLKLAYQQKKEPIIESSISSHQNVSEQIIQQQVSNKNTKTKYKYKYSQKNKYQNNGNSNIELQTDALNYFVSSMRRTWLMSLYCGVAFILRAVVLLIFADYLEDKWYVLGPYQTIFEIIPNLMMLYIYHYSTKNMTDRYKNVINR